MTYPRLQNEQMVASVSHPGRATIPKMAIHGKLEKMCKTIWDVITAFRSLETTLMVPRPWPLTMIHHCLDCLNKMFDSNILL